MSPEGMGPSHDPHEVAGVASSARSLVALTERVTHCRACPRLVEWRERVAREKRAAFADQEYWGRPVPGFGDPDAWLMIIGLAPGAHGANRTGRMFTGDRSGEWLYGALHRAGLCSQPQSMGRKDGLELRGVWITAAVRCAPPGNKPTPAERDMCRPFLERELDLLPSARVFVTLGAFAFDQTLRIFRDRGVEIPRPRPRFAHGSELTLDEGRTLLASYHPSQQNTFTGTLTEAMFDSVWARAIEHR
jgi:uracil-DNA glycosylase family 4